MAAILALEAALFAPSFAKFFCGDSLYCLSHRVAGWDELVRLLGSIDTLHSYRPLTYVVFTYLMYPLSGLDPRGYHLMALGAHLLTSLLVWALLRRLVQAPAAALAGLFYFGVHSVNFYLTYDASFLPDMGLGVPAVGCLLAFAWSLEESGARAMGARVAGLVLFALALLCKESAVMLPVGLAAVGALVRRRRRQSGIRIRELLPYVMLAAVYLLFQLYLRGGWFYPSGASPYRLSFSPAVLFLKLKYLLWLFNLPAEPTRLGWLLVIPAALMLPALFWLLARLRTGWRAGRRPLLWCAAWAAAALLPVLFVAQMPMKHNLYLPVLALAVALAVSVDGEVTSQRLWPRRAGWFFVSLAVSVAVLVQLDLKYSWVGEGSDITERSLAAVRRAYPTLPPGAMLYVQPSSVRGNLSWYFDGGSLFRLFYGDPSLETRFLSAGQAVPFDSLRRNDLYVFRFHQDRLYDVTREEKSAAFDAESDGLLARFAQAQVSSRFPWKAQDLLKGRPATVLQYASGDALRQTLLMLPGSTVVFPVPAVPKNSVLLFGVALAGQPRNGTFGRIFLQTGGQREELYRFFLESPRDRNNWWDGEVDLRGWEGRSGQMVLENYGGREADWLAWSRMRIVPRSSLFYVREEDHARPLASRDHSLLEYFDATQARTSLAWQPSDLISEQPAGILWLARAGVRRAALVMVPATTVRIPLPPASPDSRLEFGLTLSGALRGGGVGRIWLETAGQRTKLFQMALDPRADAGTWWDGVVDLSPAAAGPSALVLEAEGDHDSDWVAWSELRLVPRAGAQRDADPAGRSLPAPEFRLLDRLDEAQVSFDASEVYPRRAGFDTPNGQPQFLYWVRSVRPGRQALVTLAGSRLRWAVPPLPPHAFLDVCVTHPGRLGDGALGRIYFEADGKRELVFERMVRPGQISWADYRVPLDRWAGRAGNVVLECSSGPARNTVGDWFAWGRLRILPGS